MSTASLDRPPAPAVPRTAQGSSRRLLGGHAAVALRVHRPALIGLLALVAATAVAVLAVRVWAASGPPAVWGFTSWEFWRDGLADRGTLALLFFPALVAAFVAGPLTSRSLENGTAQLEWGQSFGPRRWLADRLKVTAAIAGAACAVLSLLMWSVQDDVPQAFWHGRGVFETRGPLLVAYTLLAVAVGALCGLLLRRGYAAVVAAPFVAAALPLGIGSLRWDIWPHETAEGLGKQPGYGSGVPLDAMSLRSGYVTDSGARLPYDTCWSPDDKREAACLAERHVTGWFQDYHPASHLWQVQTAETLLVLGLAAGAAYAAFRVLGKETR